MNKLKYFLLIILILPLKIWASGNDITEVASQYALETCLKKGAVCKLTDDIVMNYTMGVQGETILDLNGHTIAPSAELKVSGGLIVVEKRSRLTINDSTGKGLITTGASNQNVWAAIQLLKETTTENGTTELIVNGGTIEGYYYGIVGNGNKNNTKITINQGNIKGINTTDSVGIYQPQIGDIIINGGTIKGGTGIEIRSGNLTVHNGTIEGIAPNFTKTTNSNGSTTNGVGITIAQHTTKNPINVVIQDGKISGQYAFYEWNPHNNSQVDLDKIHINIRGGDFKSNANDKNAIYSQNFKKFITGGKFNTPVTEYLDDNAQVTSKIIENEETNHKNNKIWIFLTISGILIIGSLSIILTRCAS